MKTIILQETDKDILDILTYALELEGFYVYSVLDDDANFLDLIDELRPHVIMLDFRLAGTTCIRMCMEIKARYPHLPVLALSCNNNINQEYNKYGFDGYIEKPFDLEVLYGILRKHIPKHITKSVIIDTLKKSL